MASIRVIVGSLEVTLQRPEGDTLREGARALSCVHGVRESKPQSPEEMIKLITERLVGLGWREGEGGGLRIQLIWSTVGGKRDFATSVMGTREGVLYQFWSGSLIGLTEGGRTFDRMMGSARRISTEDVTEEFMGMLSELR